MFSVINQSPVSKLYKLRNAPAEGSADAGWIQLIVHVGFVLTCKTNREQHNPNPTNANTSEPPKKDTVEQGFVKTEVEESLKVDLEDVEEPFISFSAEHPPNAPAPAPSHVPEETRAESPPADALYYAQTAEKVRSPFDQAGADGRKLDFGNDLFPDLPIQHRLVELEEMLKIVMLQVPTAEIIISYTSSSIAGFGE